MVGASSMLGKRLITVLNTSGIEVITCGRDKSNDIILDLSSSKNIEFSDNANANYIFNCAASFENDSVHGFKINEQINSSGCATLVQLAMAFNCKNFINVGTIFSEIRKGSNYKLNSYAFSKLRGEQLLERLLLDTEINFCSIRLPQLIDEYGECVKHQKWFGRIIFNAFNGTDLIMPSHKSVQNFMHVKDAAMALKAALESDLSGVFHLSHPENISYQKIATIAYELFSNGGQVIMDKTKAPFFRYYFPKSLKNYNKIKFFPESNVSDCIQEIIRLKTGQNYEP